MFLCGQEERISHSGSCYKSCPIIMGTVEDRNLRNQGRKWESVLLQNPVPLLGTGRGYLEEREDRAVTGKKKHPKKSDFQPQCIEGFL